MGELCGHSGVRQGCVQPNRVRTHHRGWPSMDELNLSRRDALKLGTFGAAAVLLPVTGWVSGKDASEIDPRRIPRPFTTAFAPPATVVPGSQGGKFPSTINGLPAVTLVEQVTPVQILPGVQTQMWTYGGTFPGPTIRATHRQPIVLRVVNRLPARHPTLRYEPATSTHLHGAPSLPQYDGYANDLTRPGQYKDYYYDNGEDARTIW